MEPDKRATPSVLLDRPLLKTYCTKIDVCTGSLTVEFEGEVEAFNINESKPLNKDNNYSLCYINIVKFVLHYVHDMEQVDE